MKTKSVKTKESPENFSIEKFKEFWDDAAIRSYPLNREFTNVDWNVVAFTKKYIKNV